MSNKIMSSGELLSNLNKNINKQHHKKPDQNTTLPHEAQSQVIKQNQNQKVQSDKPIKKKQGQNQLQNKKHNQQQKGQGNQKQEQLKKKKEKDHKRQTQKSQNKTVRTNLSRATQIINKKSSFQNKFNGDNSFVQEEQLGETLHEILAMQIGKLISQPLAEVIQASIKQKENSIFIAYTQSSHDYLQNLIDIQKNKQDNSISEIQMLLAKRQQKTIEKLDNGQLFIDRERAITTKSQLQDLAKLDVARLVKIKQGAIRSKLDLLHDKMFEFQALENSPKNSTESLKKYQQQKQEQITDPNNFSLTSQKTKIANDYVKHLQHQKMMLLKSMRQRQQKRLQKQKQRQTQLKQAQQMRKEVKKQEIQQKVKQYKKKRYDQVAQIGQKSKKIEQFLKEYRKSMPLYKKKQKEFVQVYEKKRTKQVDEKLKSNRQNKRSLSLNEINQHEQKYLQKKSLDQSKKQEEFKLLLKSRKATESAKDYFKGFYHDKVQLIDQEERLKFYSMRQSTKIKVERMTQFDQKIRKLHKPKIDTKKKQELQRVIELDEMKKKKVKKSYKQVTDQNGQIKLEPYYVEIPEIDHYKEGNKYMQISKSLAKKKKPQQTSRYSQEPEINLEELEKSQNYNILLKKNEIADWQTPSPIISQEKDLWRLRGKQLSQMTDDVNSNNFYQIKKNLEIMDDKAKMREELIKHKDSDAHESMHEKGMLDEFYLESIKNKIKLLNE